MRIELQRYFSFSLLFFFSLLAPQTFLLFSVFEDINLEDFFPIGLYHQHTCHDTSFQVYKRALRVKLVLRCQVHTRCFLCTSHPIHVVPFLTLLIGFSCRLLSQGPYLTDYCAGWSFLLLQDSFSETVFLFSRNSMRLAVVLSFFYQRD